MSKHNKTRDKVCSGTANANIGFDDLVELVKHLGFENKTNSSHHVCRKPGIPEIINLQPGRDGKAKPYQVRQVKKIIEQYKLQ